MSLLSTLAGMVGLALGGPMGAAIGSGIGTLASGGDIGDALKAGVLGYGIGSIPGVSGFAGQMAGSLGMQGLAGQFAAQQTAQQAALQGLGSSLMGGGQGSAVGNLLGGMGAQGAAQGSSGLGSFFSSPMAQNLILAGLIEAGEPKPVPLTPLQKQQLETGERLPNYTGTAAPGTPSRRMAQGGYVQGPGTGTSDSIPAAIYQNGGRVQEARLSDGEFVMTADAVRGAGNGNRDAGAAKMYQLMSRFERRAANG